MRDMRITSSFPILTIHLFALCKRCIHLSVLIQEVQLCVLSLQFPNAYCIHEPPFRPKNMLSSPVDLMEFLCSRRACLRTPEPDRRQFRPEQMRSLGKESRGSQAPFQKPPTREMQWARPMNAAVKIKWKPVEGAYGVDAVLAGSAYLNKYRGIFFPPRML